MINFAIEQLKTVEESWKTMIMFFDSAQKQESKTLKTAVKKNVKFTKFTRAS
jgi:hypothetical protein